MKSYLRYEPSIKAGIIASPSCNIVYDHRGRCVMSGAQDEVSTSIEMTVDPCDHGHDHLLSCAALD
jgi:hypothetical protein